MSQFRNSETLILFYLFALLIAITLVLWVLRGLQILPSLTSGVILLLLLLSMSLGLLSLFSQTKRY